MKIRTTERLSISRLQLSDAPFIFKLLNDPEWIRYIGDRNIKTLDNARDYISNGPMKSYLLNGFGLYRVDIRDSNVAIGLCGLIKREELTDVDIGYAFLPQYRGKGYAFEAATAIVDHARTDWSLERLVAITTPENNNSIQLLNKLGMKFEKKLKLTPDGEETYLFSMNLKRG